MKLIEYTETNDNSKLMRKYQLTDLTYTGSPISIIYKSKSDSARKPIMIMDNAKLVGFFCLYFHEGPAYYGGNANTDVLIRALSIDERYRHQHLALSAMIIVDKYVRERYSDIERIILAVNHANLVAQNVYKQAGFKYSGIRTYGKLGKQFIFYKKINLETRPLLPPID